MRYQNWDVLLFPEASKIPIQEFNTKCHVISEADSSNSQASFLTLDPASGTSRGLTPVLTTFVSSLKLGEPFRISCHSWQRPSPSQMLLDCTGVNDTVMYEARICVDGTIVAYVPIVQRTSLFTPVNPLILSSSHIFDRSTVWPVVIERDSRLETKGHVEPLRFPQFHQSVMHAQAWDPADTFGRIKVTISEGLARVYSPDLPRSGGFDRFRDIVVFSFQHAPIAVLEYSEIAWPNAQSFQRARAQMLRYRSNAAQLSGTVGHEAHAHSPRRASLQCPPNAMTVHNDTMDCNNRGCTPQNHQTLHTIGQVGLHQSRWAPDDAPTSNDMANVLRAQEDPFMGPPRAPVMRGSRTRSSSHDISMEDYVSSKSTHSRAQTEMSGVMYPPKDFGRTMQEAAVEEIIEALSPVKRDQLLRALSPDTETHPGTEPPNNTPSNKPMVARSSTPKILNHTAVGGVNEDGSNLKVLGGRIRSQGSSKMKSRPSSTQPVQRNTSPASRSTSPKETFLTPENDNDSSKTSVDPSPNDSNSHRRRSTSNASKRKRSISLRPASIDTNDATNND